MDCLRLWLVSAFFLATLLLPKEVRAQNSLPKVWNGEIIETDQGLVCLYSMMIDSNVKQRGGDFSFLLKGRSNRISYSFTAKTQIPKLAPITYWKIKEDTYDVIEASFVDEYGHKRLWKGPYPKSIKVQPKSLSSMGVWYLVYLKPDDQFKLLIKEVRLKLPIEKWKGSVERIIDGISGEELSIYKGAAADNGQGIRRVLRGGRRINMVYQLDLFRLNMHAPEMSRILQINDADIRSCYTDLLERNETANGTLTYTFAYSGIAQGIKTLKIKEASLKDSSFQECLYYKLRGLTFPLRQSLIGELSFQFNTLE
ncbi:MAG: hypothetical protein H7249_10320 [Chitinophagaceae bacterium]|nr:hypothetical protein [Oligoflexus sp.]